MVSLVLAPTSSVGVVGVGVVAAVSVVAVDTVRCRRWCLLLLVFLAVFGLAAVVVVLCVRRLCSNGSAGVNADVEGFRLLIGQKTPNR